MRSSPSTTKRMSLASRDSSIASLVISRSSWSSSAMRMVTGWPGLDGCKWLLLRGTVRRGRGGGRRCLVGRGQGQRDLERSALAGHAVGGDGAALALGDPATEGEPDARPRVVLASVQALEHPEYAPAVAGVEADPVVGHL